MQSLDSPTDKVRNPIWNQTLFFTHETTTIKVTKKNSLIQASLNLKHKITKIIGKEETKLQTLRERRRKTDG